MTTRKSSEPPPNLPIKVWDVPVRVFHWGLVGAMTTAWLTGEATLPLHEAAGYVGLGLVALRAVLGWTGSYFVLFRQFLHRPAVVGRYAADVMRHSERRYVGHNPLGGWMVIALLLCVGCAGLTGWLYTLDMFWGMAWLDLLHRTLGWGLVALVAVHVAGVLFTSWRQRENLVAAMVTGCKKVDGAADLPPQS